MYNLDTSANTLSLGINFSKCDIAITGYTDRLHAAFCNRFSCRANKYAQAVRLDDRSERHAEACNCEHNVRVRCGRTHALQSLDKKTTMVEITFAGLRHKAVASCGKAPL